MITCKNCGASVSEDQKYCGECGTPVETVKEEANVKYCQNCGSAVKETQDVCLNCGSALYFKRAQQQAFPGQKSKLAAGLLGILIGGLGIHNFYLGYTQKAIIQLLLCTVGIIIIVGPIIASIWGLIDGIMILTGSINVDADGKPLAE